MASRWSTPASDAAHRSMGRREAEPDEEGRARAIPARRSAAAAIGTAVHHLLETVHLSGDLAAQVAERGDRIVEEAVAGLDGDEAGGARAALEGLLDQLQCSQCLAKLAELAPSVAARELDIAARPDDDDGTSVVSGAVDLLYTDPSDGRLVVADYKTDAVETDTEIDERCERYRPQLETYARALRLALDLEEEPHLELWFLRPDRIVRLT
jgi:ATP-dependent exoDNAse (exonuclease V) beta subunit